jgi:hypothetical protein
MTAWVMAAIHILHQYPELLANEWRERVAIMFLRDLLPGSFDRLYGEWEKVRPFARGRDATNLDYYARYRRLRFDHFLEAATGNLSAEQRLRWQKQLELAEVAILPRYQQQMSILAYLEPGSYGETRVPIPPEKAHIGLIHAGRYYFIPAFDGFKPSDVHQVRRQIATLLKYPAPHPPNSLIPLAQLQRRALYELGKKLSFAEELEELRIAPIWCNFDLRPRAAPLGKVRQAERGIGDHALTIFDTGESFVFDQSHVFFDGAWGAALAEIITNEALAWAVYLMNLPTAEPERVRPYSPAFHFSPADEALVRAAPRVMPEASVESSAVRLRPMLALRQLFKQRSDLLQLTINDLLILYRAIHAVTYQPSPALVETLKDQPTILAAVQNQANPAILIPVDASQRSPRDRLHPMTFQVPLADLDFIALHEQTLEALTSYEAGRGAVAYQRFDALQRTYLATLAGFGSVLSKAKEIANSGKSTSVGAIKLLAHMPLPLQRLLDQIPERFELLNGIIKGNEVFSNVGAVVKTSTLTRFISAKDDNEKKVLVWGAMTDANGVLRLTLRDFRPHVRIVSEPLAQQIAQDYLEAYAQGLNRYVGELSRITQQSRETQLVKGDKL